MDADGGLGSLKKAGVYLEAYRCCAAGAGVFKWCETYGVQSRAYFGASLYGEEGAKIMATEHCRRLTWFYQIFEEDGCQEGFKYTAEQLKSCPASAFFQAFAADLVKPAAMKRLLWMRDQIPR